MIIALCVGKGIGVRHVAIDCFSNVYEVVSMFDRYARPTSDPSLASTCVLKVGENFVEQNADDIPIYTVH
jgi:hypothetical protein